MNGVWITSFHNIFGLFYSSVLFLSSFVRDNENQLQLVTDLWYLRNSRCLCFTTHYFLLPLWFIRWLNPILQCVRFYFSSLMSHFHPPHSGWWSNSFHRYWLNIVYVPSTVSVLGTQCYANSINSLSSWALCSSREGKKQAEKPINWIQSWMVSIMKK